MSAHDLVSAAFTSAHRADIMKRLHPLPILATALAVWCPVAVAQETDQDPEPDIELEYEESVDSAATPASQPTPSAPQGPDWGARVAELEERLRALEKMPATTIDPTPSPAPSVVVPVPSESTLTPQDLRRRHQGVSLHSQRGPSWVRAGNLEVSGYLQAQVEVHQLSEDELAPDGRPLNQDRFLVRRARLRADRMRDDNYFSPLTTTTFPHR